ncbi:Acyl-CoA reductase [Lentzea albida]|uniref:Acyl-CoA reductase n=1 Tax=Lentzea albida TaxID=65499 RepID=A0A1H9K142_9PSEU|nr:aldehyde dehydrogenase family protein [Lentzea albida]SEQ92718.1 Acyl-CoA reductase [Lentzea albida]
MTLIAEPRTGFTTGLFVDGTWSDAVETFEDLNPATGEVLARVSHGSAADVDLAVRAARAALDGAWGDTPGVTRGVLLNRLADLVERDGEVLQRLEALDVGKPFAQPGMLDVPNAAATFRHFAGWADKAQGATIPTAGYLGTAKTHSYTVREPVGVIGAIIPWNTPLMIAAWKLGPALAAGNTVVVKPAEDAPLSILHLATLVQEAGFPAGVVNVVPGLGGTTGAALVAHPDVDKISFTGSPEVGRQIQKSAADTFKRVTLELGGKSPQIVCEDADVRAAVQGIAMGLFFNQGEVCAAGTRILVHRSHYENVVDALAQATEAQVLGDPFDARTTMGALVNAKQKQRVADYVEKGKAEGARLVAGGGEVDGPGFFVRPTIFADVDNASTIAREEIFGPVGAVIPFDTVEEALAIANDTEYGLAATIWTRDVSLAHTMAAKVRAGAVWVNGWAAIDPALPWGGMKSSGIGRELGCSGILANTEEKVVTIVLQGRFLRYSRGDWPNAPRKSREKCAGSVKPQRWPTFAIGTSAHRGSARSRRQRSRRRPRIIADTEVPSASKTFCRWRTETKCASATVFEDRPGSCRLSSMNLPARASRARCAAGSSRCCCICWAKAAVTRSTTASPRCVAMTGLVELSSELRPFISGAMSEPSPVSPARRTAVSPASWCSGSRTSLRGNMAMVMRKSSLNEMRYGGRCRRWRGRRAAAGPAGRPARSRSTR